MYTFNKHNSTSTAHIMFVSDFTMGRLSRAMVETICMHIDVQNETREGKVIGYASMVDEYDNKEYRVLFRSTWKRVAEFTARKVAHPDKPAKFVCSYVNEDVAEKELKHERFCRYGNCTCDKEVVGFNGLSCCGTPVGEPPEKGVWVCTCGKMWV